MTDALMDSVDLAEEFEVITEDQAKEAATGDLIPTGTYEGVLLSANGKTVDRETSPYFGKRTYWTCVELYVDGVPRKHWFSVAAAQVHVEGKLRGESKLGAQLAKATGTIGQPFNHALDAAKVTRLRYRVRLSPEKGQYDARNWTDAISPVVLS